MAHPSRTEAVKDLGDRLDREVEVVWDRGLGEWDTASRAWLIGMQRVSDYHLVLQDDVLPARDLLGGVESILSKIGGIENNLMSLFFGSSLLVKDWELGPGGTGELIETPRHKQVTRACDVAEHIGASYIEMPGPIWGPAFLMRTVDIPEMLKWCEGKDEVYDTRITLWCIETGRVCYQTYPSLVEHKDLESLVLPGRTHARVARKFLGADVSALTFDPTGDVVRMR